MNNVRYWSVVASMGPGLDTARLSLALDSLEPDDLHQFCLWVDARESDLDTPAHRDEATFAYELARSAEVDRSWPAPEKACPAVLEELQATVVAHGKDTWQATRLVPALLSGGWPTGLGRQFLAAVAEAVRRSLPKPQPA